MAARIRGRVDYSGCTPIPPRVKPPVSKPMEKRGEPWSYPERKLLLEILEKDTAITLEVVARLFPNRALRAVKHMAAILKAGRCRP